MTSAALRKPIATPAAAIEIVSFWKRAGIELWFANDPEFDRRFTATFLALHEEAARGDHDHWTETPEGSLALIILLDQFPRNAFRGTPRMYATDAHARRIAAWTVAWGQDLLIEPDLRLFVYLPFGHSEALSDQDRAIELVAHLGPSMAERAEKYRSIIRKFGRFPHRNAILGRETLTAEEEFLRNGGFSG